MAFAIKRRPPSLMALISIHFFTQLFSFAIESYIHETDFTLGRSQKYHFFSPLIIGSKLTFTDCCYRQLPYSAMFSKCHYKFPFCFLNTSLMRASLLFTFLTLLYRFLAVQDSSIGDIVSQSLSHLLISTIVDTSRHS